MGNISTLDKVQLKLLNDALERFSATNHGPNEHTLESIKNILCLYAYFNMAISSMNGILTSAYRSSAVNEKVGGEKTSRHLRGLALDIVPIGMMIPDAFVKLSNEILDGDHGHVRKIILEPSWIHIDWHEMPWDGDDDKPIFMRKLGKDYKRVYMNKFDRISL